MFRWLYDYAYECDIQEAVVFLYCYFFIEYYILINIAIIFYFTVLGGDFTVTFPNGYTSGLGYIIYFFLIYPTFIPPILNTILTICIMMKKRVKRKTITPFAFFLSIALLLFSCLLPDFLGILVGLIPPVFLMMKFDNSLEKEIKAMEKENFEQQINVEKLLYEEQLARRKAEELGNTAEY